MDCLYKCRHFALVVVTDGVHFVVLQLCGCVIQHFHTLPDHETGNCTLADDVMLLIAHHLLYTHSTDSTFQLDPMVQCPWSEQCLGDAPQLRSFVGCKEAS